MLLKTASTALLAILLSSVMAAAQQQDTAADPADSLAGLWRAEHAEGPDAASVPAGKLIRINRLSIAGFTVGACTNPTFKSSQDQNTVKLAIICLGQDFADVEWSGDNPDLVMWKEPDLKVSLRRVATQPARNDGDDKAGADETGEGASQ